MTSKVENLLQTLWRQLGMSFEQNYGTYFEPNVEDDFEAIPLTKEETIQMKINQQLEIEGAELEQIKEADKRRID